MCFHSPSHRARPRYIADHRTRKDRTDRRTFLFNQQMDDIATAYMAWSAGGTSPNGTSDGEGGQSIRVCVVDVFSKSMWFCNGYTQERCAEYAAREVLMRPEDNFVTVGLVRQGLFPCAPINPSVAMSTEVLELYRVAHLRCPCLSIHAFTKTLCDLHSVSGTPVNSSPSNV